MRRQYSFSRREAPPQPAPGGAVLAIDTGSPVVSVAISVSSAVVAERATEIRQSSGRLLRMIDEALVESGLALSDLDLLLALRGPGSFTGLRVGLATLQGMRMALGTATATLPTLQVLATLAPAGAPRITGCVDALRGEWLAQDFSCGPLYSPLDEPSRTTSEDLSGRTSSHCVGFGVSRLVSPTQVDSGLVLIEPGPLAAQALRILETCEPDRDPALLADPLYLQGPPVTPPSRGESR